MPLSATVALSLSGRHTGAGDLGVPTQAFTLAAEAALTDGIGAGQADREWTDERTILASANENIDLAGVLQDAFGQGATFAKVKALIVKADAGNTNDVVVTRPASNGAPLFLAAGDGISVKPGYTVALFGSGAGYPVTGATGDLINIANGGAGTPVTYKIAIIGTSA